MYAAIALVFAGLTACDTIPVGIAPMAEPDTAAAVTTPEDQGDHSDDEAGQDAADPLRDTGEPEVPPEDDATIQEIVFPAALSCGQTATAAVSVRNTGTATWTRAGGYKLGTVDDADPFYTRDTRVWLSDEVTVTTGQVWTFELELLAPETAGSYTTDWQMVREGIHWFGDTMTHEIEVSCEEPAAPSGPPDLDEVIWLHSDISGWPQTSVLSSVTQSGSEICMDYDMADSWPIYDLRGTDVVANPWIFIWQDGAWYGATWEWMRPGQICKAMSSVHSSHIKVEPFPEDGDWAPTSGQRYWFMLSGLARWSERTVEERTNLVSFVWP
jgi:hypothetical protein